jgi:aminodeoxyfutalosine synthase
MLKRDNPECVVSIVKHLFTFILILNSTGYMLEKLVRDSKALEKAISGEELSYDDGLELMSYDNLYMLGAAADLVRQKRSGNTVTFAASYYLNYTNICAASCQMCAFYRKGNESDAYTLTPQDIEARVGKAKEMGATEVHIVGGFHPELPLEYYEEMFRTIKKSHPEMNIKALTAAEIFFLSKLTKNSVKEVLTRFKASGLDTMPGGGAELFHPEVRNKIVRGKCSGQEWLDTIEKAHDLGIKSNATMLFGHVEKPEHIVDHLVKLREVQKRTKGFITLIPLKFSLENTELEKAGLVKSESPSTYDLRVIAVSRLMLAQQLDNISVYWVALGKKLAQVALTYGGNDLVGTAFSEEIYRAAGRGTNSSIEELANMIKEIGREAAQRDTFFNILKTF